MSTAPHCTDSERRRQLVTRINQDADDGVLVVPSLNGIEHIELVQSETTSNAATDRRIRIHFLTDHGRQYRDDGLQSSDGLEPTHTGFENSEILIRGRRPKPLEVVGTAIPIDHPNRAIDVLVRGMRESETYTLQLVKVQGNCRTNETLEGFDPRFATTTFTWREQPSTHIDPLVAETPKAPLRDDADVDYLARDYASLRRLLLDRLVQIMPQWRERNASDIGVTLVELLAWVGDRLAYQQDAVGTEAYLGTARQRISVRRHARLVDYRVHEGCNARTLMHIEVTQDVLNVKLDAFHFCTSPADEFRVLREKTPDRNSRWIRRIPDHQYERFYDSVQVFEPIDRPLRETLLTTNDLIDAQSIVNRLGRVGEAEPVPRDSRADVDASETASQSPSQNANLTKIWNELRFRLQREILARYRDSAASGVSEHLEHQLIDEFNRLIQEERLEPNPFDGKLSTAASALAACHNENADFAIDNRKFLDEVFPGELSPIGADFHLIQSHNEIHFYTWDEDECWLPTGSTSATLLNTSIESVSDDIACEAAEQKSNGALRRDVLRLSVGDLLIFEEVKGPKTGNLADANPAHRHAVRLTRVCKELDPVHDLPIVEIEWSEEDALPFSLCLSSTASEPVCCAIRNVSVARGNVLLADHGRTVEEPTTTLGGRPATERFVVRGKVEQFDCGDRIRRPRRAMVPEPFRPWLSQPDLTYAESLQRQMPVSKLLTQDVQKSLPAIKLTGIPGDGNGNLDSLRLAQQLVDTSHDNFPFRPSRLKSLLWMLPPELAYWWFQPGGDGEPAGAAIETGDPKQLARVDLQECTLKLLKQATRWEPRYDLIDSASSDRHFVVEVDNERRAWLRFGDDQLGMKPTVGTQFFARYRVGNGQPGNVGAESLTWMISDHEQTSSIGRIRNPLAAVGGRDPQPLHDVKLLAPHAYRESQPRAITADDYRRLVREEFAAEVQDARAVIQPAATGKLVMVAIDPFDSVGDLPQQPQRIQRRLHRVRGIGHHVHVMLADYVPLVIDIKIRVNPAWRRSLVRLALSERFSNRTLKDGERGLFHPDNLTFGNDIHKSHLIAAAQAVPGVEGVEITRLSRVAELAAETGRSDSDASLPKSVPDKLVIGPLQIARLDNNGSASKGQLCLTLEGGT